MLQSLMHITTQSPDTCHTLGQALLRPASLFLGHTYELKGGIVELKNEHLLKRISVVALALILLPITLLAAAIGSILLASSSTHQKAYEQLSKSEITIRWAEGAPEVQSKRLLLRPIRETDLPVYKKLFTSELAMSKFAGGVRDITNRFQIWHERWKLHSFSALAVVDRQVQKVIGHVISGHGDYEGNLNTGWSEIAYVIEPAYWNCDFKDEAKGIGTAGHKHIGSEIARASVAYAKALNNHSIPVPSDVTESQRPEIEEALEANTNLKVHRTEQGQVDWVYLPFTELRASVHKENKASYALLQNIFQTENGASLKRKDEQRDLFVMSF